MAQGAIGPVTGLTTQASDAQVHPSEVEARVRCHTRVTHVTSRLNVAVGAQRLPVRALDLSVQCHIGRDAHQHPMRSREQPEPPKTHRTTPSVR